MQVNGINVEKCSHEEVVSIWVSFIRVLETTLMQNQSDSTEALDPYQRLASPCTASAVPDR